MSGRGVSVVVPTYKEAGNLPNLIARLGKVRDEHDLDLELLVCDDDSRDGTEKVIEDAGSPWVRLILRKENRGLSPAVLDGLRAARHDFFVVMDADLSHPPEKIPDLLKELDGGADFVIGSRYVKGGSTDAEWGLFRWLNSKIATLLAWPLTSARDPMAGFFALRRETFENARDLNPIGYKIGLELIVKCGCARTAEVPIHFADRQVGESKLSFKEQLRYLQHLRRLYMFRHPNFSHIVQFGLVGLSGTVVNLAVLTLLVTLRVPREISVGSAILVSMSTNFLLNRRFTFSYARLGSFWMQYLGFVLVSLLGALTNFAVTLTVAHHFPGLWIQAAALVGIVAGMIFNYLLSRYLVFRKPGGSPKEDAVGVDAPEKSASTEGQASQR